jgi:hypothetical protein
MKRPALILLMVFALATTARAQDDQALPYAVALGGQAALVIAVFAIFHFAKAPTIDGLVLPFTVTIAGQNATMEPEQPYATISEPVTGDAEVMVEVEGGTVILDLSKAKADGSRDDEAEPAIHLLRGTKMGLLHKLHHGRKIEPGIYYLSVVADGRSASIRFSMK